MRAGALRHKVLIEDFTATQDALGGHAKAWTTFATAWAAIEPLRGREYFDASAFQGEIDTRVRIRHVDGVRPRMRVNWPAESRVFDVQSVAEINTRDREIHLMCKEYFGDGES